MGKPRLGKYAMGADDCEAKELNCLSCGKLFKSFNPKRIRICSKCKRSTKRKQSEEIEFAKDQQIPAATTHNSSKIRLKKSKY